MHRTLLVPGLIAWLVGLGARTAWAQASDGVVAPPGGQEWPSLDVGFDLGSDVAPDPSEEAPPPETLAAGPHVIFLNFDSVMLVKAGLNDSRTNKTFLVSKNVTAPAFDPASVKSTKSALVAEFVKRFDPYNVMFVTTRPDPSVNYTMQVMGGTCTELVGF